MSKKSTPLRPRTAWYPVIVSVADEPFELQIGWKFVDGSVGFFSSATKNKKDKHPWGQVINCSFKVMNEDEPTGRFVLENRGREKRGFRTNELLPSLWEINEFTSKLLELRTEGKSELLAMYFQLLLHSKKFHEHRKGFHDELGFNICGSGMGHSLEMLKGRIINIIRLQGFC